MSESKDAEDAELKRRYGCPRRSSEGRVGRAAVLEQVRHNSGPLGSPSSQEIPAVRGDRVRARRGSIARHGWGLLTRACWHSDGDFPDSHALVLFLLTPTKPLGKDGWSCAVDDLVRVTHGPLPRPQPYQV